MTLDPFNIISAPPEGWLVTPIPELEMWHVTRRGLKGHASLVLQESRLCVGPFAYNEPEKMEWLRAGGGVGESYRYVRLSEKPHLRKKAIATIEEAVRYAHKRTEHYERFGWAA